MEHNCIIYSGYIGKNGYGYDYNPETKKTISAHRLAFKLAYGHLPKVVMHTCDNPKCVNPKHLKAGTQSDNIKDSYNKGRSKGNIKLTRKQRDLISKDKRSSRVIAKEYEINQKTVCNIKNRIAIYDKT